MSPNPHDKDAKKDLGTQERGDIHGRDMRHGNPSKDEMNTQGEVSALDEDEVLEDEGVGRTEARNPQRDAAEKVKREVNA